MNGSFMLPFITLKSEEEGEGEEEDKNNIDIVLSISQ